MPKTDRSEYYCLLYSWNFIQETKNTNMASVPSDKLKCIQIVTWGSLGECAYNKCKTCQMKI